MVSLTSQGTGVSKDYASYVLLTLGTASFFNFLDRSAFTVLAVPIKAELKLSDTAIGLLGGFGFALFYALMGVPLARLADRHNRVTILSISLAIWSLATAYCGLAANLVQLALGRVGVGAGEAGCTPACYSILADYFPPERRAFATGMYYTGGNIGLLCGLMLSGLLAETVGWRATFVMLGVPGVAFALLMKLTVREPARGRLDRPVRQDGGAAVPTIRRLLTKRPAFVHLTAGYTIATFGFYAALTWLPHFFRRIHGLDSADIGLRYGLSFGGGMVVGVALGAVLAPRLIARDRRWEMWFPAVVTALSLPAFAGLLLVDDANIALLLTAIACALFSMSMGPGLACLQSLSEAPIRATATAVFFLTATILGQGFGPTLVGIGSDWMTFVHQPLRWALLLSQLSYGWAAVHFYLGGRRYLADAVC